MQQSKARIHFFVLILTILSSPRLPASAEDALSTEKSKPNRLIQWQSWDEKNLFKKDDSLRKPVLLNLRAVWCHWCHVMEQTTYTDPEVAKIIIQSFIATEADQDQRPDLGARYRDWGWPATILFDADGHEIKKVAGFIEPGKMVKILTDALDPVAKTASDSQTNSSNAPQSPEGILDQLAARHQSAVDSKLGGLRTSHKFLDPDSLEYGLRLGTESELEHVKLTLKNNLLLLDPVWGGFYQYSTGGVWTNPHFEKIMSAQADNIRMYSAASEILSLPEYLTPAARTADYLIKFLGTPGPAFAASQDSDLHPGEHSAGYFSLNDTARRALGMPAIDSHFYSRENGKAIEALADLFNATDDSKYLDAAVKAARWINDQRALTGGGFSHSEKDAAGPYLGDTLSMGRAFLALYQAQSEIEWLEHAKNAGTFIIDNFSPAPSSSGNSGFISAVQPASSRFAPARSTAENIATVRFLNLLSEYSGEQSYKDAAKKGLSYLLQPDVALDSISEPGIIIAAEELNSDPIHIAVVGSKGDSSTQSLIKAARSFPSFYKRVDLYDRKAGPPPNPDMRFPQLNKSAAYVCTNKRCSMPIFNPNDISKVAKELSTQ
jgi:uncharacterized protein YyaL (SSP411 family)